jgi:hypothetical protein
MTPGAAVQKRESLDRKVSWPPIRTFLVDPLIQGPAGWKAQGVGVPEAAAVRALQVPNGGMLELKYRSSTVAAHWLAISTLSWLFTVSCEGVSLREHFRMAP